MSELYETLVPTEMMNPHINEVRPIRVRYHRVWDNKVRAITGGMTILSPGKGQWISPSGELFKERMIPVLLVCSKDQIEEIAKFTLEHYNQQAVLYFKVSSEVVIKHR